MVTTTIILVAAFSTIFVVASIGSNRPPQSPPEIEKQMPNEFQEMMLSEIARDRNQSQTNLAITLVLVGLATELAVFFASKFYAEKSIKPVRDAYLRQREFIANASHELKTPIAAARANFEALGATEEPWASNVDKELDRASNLVSDLLALARTENSTKISEKKPTNLTKLVKNRTDLIKARLNGKNLELDLKDNLSTKLVAGDFTQILDILLDNAVKYSSRIIIIKLDNKTLEVLNDGRKIPSDKIDKIFERFYQVDKTAEGSGLGLSIAKATADQNHWELSATSDKKLTTFKLVF